LKSASYNPRRTKIVCTIGPASGELETLRELIQAGMNIARLNLSHGQRAEHELYIRNIRKLTRELKTQVSILMDFPGPKYRTGALKEGAVMLKKSDYITLTTRPVEGDAGEVSVNLPALAKDVHAGDNVLVDDGAIRLRVEEVKGEDVVCRVVSGGKLTPGRGVVVPGMRISSPYITEGFNNYIDLAVREKPDFVAISMAGSAKDVRHATDLLRRKGCHSAVITKIERQQAVAGFAEILAASDGIMVARGDLGVDMPLPRIPVVQKEIIRLCNRAGKPVITATQMLESMLSAARPTRAEVTDVSNAIFDGTDAVMLSGETSIGKYPVGAVKIMSAVARETEKHLPYARMLTERGEWVVPETDELIAYNACYSAARLKARAIVAYTTSGSTARRLTKYRPAMPILAITPDAAVYGQLALCWGVIPVRIAEPQHVDELFATAAELAKRMGLAAEGDLLVITGGLPIGVAGTTNMLKVETVV
jgi:pyruvate kinase